MDYSKSTIIIADDCICTMKKIAAYNKALEKEKEIKMIEAKLTKEFWVLEKIQRKAAKLQCHEEAKARCAFAKKWSIKVII